MAICLLGLGANLGDRAATLDRAAALLAAHSEIHDVRMSSKHETVPIGGPTGQSAFLNAALRLETSLSPIALHGLLREIETTCGRERHERWAARTLDLDLLLFEDEVIETDELTVPHPRMGVRRFVLEPASEVAADMPHRSFGMTVGELLQHLNDAPNYLAVTGPPSVDKRAVLESLAARRRIALVYDDSTSAAHPLGQAESHAELLSHIEIEPGLWLCSDFCYGQTWTQPDDDAEPPLSPKLLVVLRGEQAGAPRRDSEYVHWLLPGLISNRRGPWLALSVGSPESLAAELDVTLESMQ